MKPLLLCAALAFGTLLSAQAPQTSVMVTNNGSTTLLTSKLGGNRLVFEGVFEPSMHFGEVAGVNLDIQQGAERLNFSLSGYANPSTASFYVSYTRKGQAEKTATISVQDLAAKNFEALKTLGVSQALWDNAASHIYSLNAASGEVVVLKGMALALVDAYRTRENFYIWFYPASAVNFGTTAAEWTTADGWLPAAQNAIAAWEVNP